MISLRRLLAVAFLTASSASSASSTPKNGNVTATRNHLGVRAIQEGIPMRIMPLGDSITYGDGSTHGNGYRGYLFDQLTGNEVQYIGSMKSGRMRNNQNEGHSGAIIDEITKYASNSLSKQPSIILIMAGTNDMDRNINVQEAPDRLGRLLDKVIGVCPNAVILVAQLTPTKKTDVATRVEAFNAAIPGVVAKKVNSGAKVLVVDMYNGVKLSEMADDLHPKDIGYLSMARTWYAGLEKAASKGWIVQPIDIPIPGSSNSSACTTTLFWESKGTIASGVGKGDGPFLAGWQPVGTLATGGVGTPFLLFPVGEGIRLADLNGDGRDDYLWVHPETGAVNLCINNGYTQSGGVDWNCIGKIASGAGDAKGVIFADLNGDGRDDYIFVQKNGDVIAYINGGQQSNAANGWSWIPLGTIVSASGATRATTRFADIDGDGRAEYLIVGPSGSLLAYLNTGSGDRPEWQGMGNIATGGVGADIEGVFLQDLNNDGRADYIYLDPSGAMTVYINTRGAARGMAPDWVSVGKIATGVGASRIEIMFGDLNGDGKKDYVKVSRVEGALQVWLNTGSGSTYVAGDGTRFADMDGDSLDDYLSLDPSGAIILYRNNGLDSNGKWIWENQGTIATGVAARKDIRIADLDGDGLADYLVVDENSGAVNFWRNGGPGANGWIWENRGQVATGIGAGIGVQFADIDGDGKADYLWIDKNGAVTAYLNGGSGVNGWIWSTQGVIATGVGGLRRDIQFADIDGDGLADYLWVHPLDGSVMAWINGGSLGFNNWRWYPQGKLAAGVGSNGLSIQFADLHGEGRSDYLEVTPSSGAVADWYNGCYGGTDPDSNWQEATCNDSGVIDASLPSDQRWGGVYATNAWVAVLANWRANPSTLSFPQHVSNFFHGPENMQCGVTVDHNGCGATALCKDAPAGFFILNSFQQVYSVNMNFYDAIVRVESQMASNMTRFAKLFAPIDDKIQIAKVFLDIAGLGFALTASPVWNILLKNAKYFKDPNNLSTLKDMVNGGVSNSISLTKDTLLAPSKFNSAENLESAMNTLITSWYQTIDAVNTEMFSGSRESLPRLTEMIVDGKMLGGVALVSDNTIQKYIMSAVYAYLIPQAWRLSKKAYPFILDSKKPCTGTNPEPRWVRDKHFKATSLCYENIVYFLVSTDGNANPCGADHDLCIDTWFDPPPGLSSLDGTSFGGVTKDDFIIGALAGYRANGNRNGWAPASAESADTVAEIYKTTIRTAGVVSLPICTADEAFSNFLEDKFGDDNYPCN